MAARYCGGPMSAALTMRTLPAAAEPIRPDLWDMALPAVEEVIAALKNYLAEPGHVPRARLPVFNWRSGWPLSQDAASAEPDSPINYTALIGSAGQPIDASSLARVDDFCDFALSDPQISVRLLPNPPGITEKIATTFGRVVAFNLPEHVAAHAMELGVEDAASLKAIYCLYERSWLQEHLTVDYVVPLVLTRLDRDDPIVISPDTQLVKMDEDTLTARAIAGRHAVIDPVPSALSGAATHALIIGPRVLDNPGPVHRMLGQAQPNFEDVLAQADLVCEALRIVGVKPVGYASVLYVPRDWSSGWRPEPHPDLTVVTTVRRYPEALDRHGWLADTPAFPGRWLDDLPSITDALGAAAPRVRLASRRLSQSALRADTTDRLLDACIGIEAVIGGGEKTEITHRLAQRVGVALATSRTAAGKKLSLGSTDLERVYSMMKSIYSDRSKIAHGATHMPKTLNLRGESVPTYVLAEDVLRNLIIEALDRPDDVTGPRLDELLLFAATKSFAQDAMRVKAPDGSVARAIITASPEADYAPEEPHPDRPPR